MLTLIMISPRTKITFQMKEQRRKGRTSAQFKIEKAQRNQRGKAKPKFTFHSQRKKLSCTVIHDDTLCVPSKVHNLSDNLDAILSRTENDPAAECLEDFLEEFEEHIDVGPAENFGNNESLIAELLDGLKDKTGLQGGCPKLCSQVRGRMHPIVEKGALVALGDTRSDSEDSHTLVDTGSSSGKVNDQKLKLAGPYTKEQSLTDRFEEALFAACMDAERNLGLVSNPLGIGLFGKLQRVMQSEKERETNFLNGLHCSTVSNGCIDVKILSRYLDAKLTIFS